jgi:hypothetical protein
VGTQDLAPRSYKRKNILFSIRYLFCRASSCCCNSFLSVTTTCVYYASLHGVLCGVGRSMGTAQVASLTTKLLHTHCTLNLYVSFIWCRCWTYVCQEQLKCIQVGLGFVKHSGRGAHNAKRSMHGWCIEHTACRTTWLPPQTYKSTEDAR